MPSRHHLSTVWSPPEHHLNRLKHGALAMMRGIAARWPKFEMQRAVSTWLAAMAYESDVLHMYQLEKAYNASLLGTLGSIFHKWRAQVVQRLVLRWRAHTEQVN